MCRHNLVVKCVLPKHNSRVRFPLPAPEMQTNYSSPLGNLIIESDGKSLNKLYFSNAIKTSTIENNSQSEIFVKIKTWLDQYFSGKVPQVNFEIEPCGTPFQKIVWQCVSKIPYGKSATYKEIAGQVAKLLGRTSMSARAVARAIGSNNVAIIIPCHRVVGSNGALCGYKWGIECKKKLLRLENKTKEISIAES